MRSLLFYFFRRNPHNIDDLIWLKTHENGDQVLHDLEFDPFIIEKATADYFITRMEVECSYKSGNGKKHSFFMLYGAYVNNPAEYFKEKILKNATRLLNDDLTRIEYAGIDFCLQRKSFIR